MNENMTSLKIKAATNSARSCLFKCSSGKTLDTPVSLTSTSRGIIPHLTPDHVQYLYENKSIEGFSFPAEDFLDKLPDVQSVPFYKYAEIKENGKKISDLLTMPSGAPIFVTSRRSSPVPSPKPNTKDSISIMTSEGFRYLPLDIYYQFSAKFGADLVISPSDMPNLSPGGTPGGNRARNMMKRSENWLEGLLAAKEKLGQSFDIVGSVLPALTIEQQKEYLDAMLRQKNKLKGIAFHSRKSAGRLSEKMAKDRKVPTDTPSEESYDYLSDLIQYINDESLLRVFTPAVESPQQALELISHGIDVMYSDYVYGFTNAGIALDFEFPVDDSDSPFSYNLWDTSYNTAMVPLGKRHETYYGIRYKRAYIHHLLQAHEMTAWIILQLHNMEVNTRFFQGIRSSIENGTFEKDKKRFLTKYDSCVKIINEAAKTSGPKTRGYMVSYEREQILKKQGVSSRLNDPAYKQL